MKLATRGVVLLALQAALVLSTAAKYLWERHTRPMVWVKAAAYGEFAMPAVIKSSQSNVAGDADRYFTVQLLADACALPYKAPVDETDFSHPIDLQQGNNQTYKERKDKVRVVAQEGKLAVVESEGVKPNDTQELMWDLRKPCSEARLPEMLKFYIPAGQAMLTDLRQGQTLWALVTVPEHGPPRPVKLALSDASGFHPLDSK